MSILVKWMIKYNYLVTNGIILKLNIIIHPNMVEMMLFFMVNTKINPVAAALLNFFNSFCRLTFQGLKLCAYFEHNCFHSSIRLHENKA